MKSFCDLTEEEQARTIEEASIANAGHMGTPMDMWHPDYGWILKDGEPTEAGLRFFKDNLKQFKKK